jgi:hypothetical protein
MVRLGSSESSGKPVKGGNSVVLPSLILGEIEMSDCFGLLEISQDTS